MSVKTAKPVFFLYSEEENVYSVGEKLREIKGVGSPSDVTIASSLTNHYANCNAVDDQNQ